MLKKALESGFVQLSTLFLNCELDAISTCNVKRYVKKVVETSESVIFQKLDGSLIDIYKSQLK